MNAMSPAVGASDDQVMHDPIALRRVLGRFATGVAVVTTRSDDGQPIGLTVNSFASVSLTPPLVSWCLRRDAASFPVFAAARHWAISVLASTQVNLARQFCGLPAERFAGVSCHDGLGGAPLLDGAIARLECSAFHGVDGGDHHIFLGRVEAYATGEGAPLLFHGGSFGDWLPHAA